MDVYWLKQCESEVPHQQDWLSAREASFLDNLRFPQRRASWRLGRWTAKRALATFSNLPDSPSSLAKIEVRPEPSGAPEAFFENKIAPVAISLSHRHGTAVCAIAPSGAALGCDLEMIEDHSDPFVADYFTAEEQSLVRQQSEASQPRLLALIWSAKESALKALHVGLRLDTRSVEVELNDCSADGTDWDSLRVHHSGGQIFDGWWKIIDAMVLTFVATPSLAIPIALKVSADQLDGVPGATRPVESIGSDAMAAPATETGSDPQVGPRPD